jgi:hypothetical protein
MKIYELVINPEESNDAEVSYIALVDAPAIKKDFIAFNENFVEPGEKETEDEFISRCIRYVVNEGKDQEQAAAICYSKWDNRFQKFQDSYDDYPEAAKEAARTALRYAEENGWGSCGTPVGKVRANQLAKGEAITRETIARMAAFDRHRDNSDKPLGDGCGRLMWLAWGGDAGVEWAQRKLKQIDKENLHAFAIQNEDERIITGPLMIPQQLIYRNNERFGEHYVKFSAETIRQIAIKFAKKGYQKNVNLMHDSEMQPKDVTMFESFISDSSRGVKPMEQFSDLPDGTWFGSFYVENPEVWKLVKDGNVKGFSVEGMFDYEMPESQEEKYSRLIVKELAEIFKHF